MADKPNFKDCCEIVLANPIITPKTDEYFRTASRDLVDLLKKIECKQCLEKDRPEKTFSVAKPAVIAFCGHYVHRSCLFVDGEQKYGNFICDACRKKEDESIPGHTSTLQVFTEFFKHIEQADGFRCKECKKLHPKGNVVKIYGDDDGDRSSRSDKYLCVWCASEDTYINHWIDLVRQGRPADRQTDRQLHSVERILHCSYYLNLQCCSCMKEVVWQDQVIVPGFNDSYPHSHGDKEFKTAYLLCGHIRCEECNKKGGPVYCNLCKWKQYKKISVEQAKNCARRSHVQEYVNSYDAPKAGRFVMSWECCECKKRHPDDNITTIGILKKNICMWCKVYKSLGKKTKWEKAQKKKTSPGGEGAKYRKLSNSSAEES